MKKVRVGVVGIGRLGSEHARIYSGMKEASLVGVVDSVEERALEIGKKHGTESFTDYSCLFGEVEAVSIAVPTDLHYRIAKDFLERGIHVLLEKPITQTLNQAKKLISLSEKKKTIFQIGHIERFNSALQKLGRQVKNPRFIECHRLSPYQERGTEVGVVLDLMIHDIDIILNLVKSPIKRIEAIGVKVLSPYEDIANARITFANGAVANVTSSRISREKMRKMRIFEKDSYASVDFLHQTISTYKRAGRRIIGETPKIKKVEPLKLELRHFINCILRKRKPLVSGTPAKEALRVALRISRKIKK
jgi:predicted dehydrogenase